MSNDISELNFAFYSDLLISKVKEFKEEYASAYNENNLKRIKQVIRKIRDTRYLFQELNAIANKKKEEISQLFEVDLDG